MNKKKIVLAATVGVLTLAMWSISVSASNQSVNSIGKIFSQSTSAKVNLDKDGNVVDSKGNIVKTKDQFEQDQKKYTKENPYTLEVGQDGKIIENGVPVTQSSEGSVVYAHIDENGNMVDDKGNILAKKADIQTLDGEQGSTTHTASIKVNFDKDGNVVDSEGNIVKTKDQFEQDQKKYTKENPYTVEVGQDGKIIENGVSVKQSSEASGPVYAHIDENGNMVDDEGNILAKKADIHTLDGDQVNTTQTAS